jgi:hypothetical protein
VPAERLLLALLISLFALANLMPGERMQFDRGAIAGGEIWRLWTGQLCHWSSLHLVGNLAAVAALTVIAGKPLRRWLALLPLAAPLLSLALLSLLPELQTYRGLSGLVAVLVVGVAIDGGVIGRVAALAWGAKLAFDAISGTPITAPACGHRHHLAGPPCRISSRIDRLGRLSPPRPENCVPIMNRRRFILGAAAAAALLGAGGTALARRTLWNPCRASLPPEIASHDVVRAAWQGLSADQVWDCHAHLAGIGDGGSGVTITPRMLSPLHPTEYFQRLFYLNAGCAHEAPGRVDQSYVERLHNLADGMQTGFKLMLLAFERTHDAHGRPQPELTAFHVPNAYARDVARPIRPTLSGSAPSIPTGRIVSKPWKVQPAMAHVPSSGCRRPWVSIRPRLPATASTRRWPG